MKTTGVAIVAFARSICWRSAALIVPDATGAAVMVGVVFVIAASFSVRSPLPRWSAVGPTGRSGESRRDRADVAESGARQHRPLPVATPARAGRERGWCRARPDPHPGI